MMKQCKKTNNLQEPQRNRNVTAYFVNLIRTSTVQYFLFIFIICFLKASIILNVKVVLNDIFKYGGERV